MTQRDLVDGASDAFSFASRRFFGPLWAWKERSPYLRYLPKLIRSPYRPIEQVKSDQVARLRTLFIHAEAKCPFYSARFKDAGFDPAGLTSLEDLAAVPITTKDDIRENRLEMLGRDCDPRGLVTMTTSGSTGVSLMLHMDEMSRQWKRACTIRHDMWSGWRMGDSVGAVWGNPDAAKNWRCWLRNKLLLRHIPLDTLRMDDAAMSHFNSLLIKHRPTALFGHAHSLYLFARYVSKHGLKTVRPRGIISTAMVLHDFERACIEDVFQAKVFNRYGCEEVSLIASECEAHEGLHTNCDTLVVEVVGPDGKPVPNGVPGAVVVTDMTNLAMPVIRYKVGDMATLKDSPCSCGKSYPLLASLEGRIADYVRTPGGEYISGISLTENFAMQLAGVKQLQIVQERIDFLRFRVVLEQGDASSGLESLPELVRKRFGNAMGHEVERVDSIQSERSGKYRFCISKLDDSPF